MSAAHAAHLQRLRHAQGRTAEEQVRLELMRRGYRLVEKVEVPVVRTRDGKIRSTRRVSGDFRGVLPPTGVSLLVEVKSTKAGARLAWGDFRHPHQPQALDEHMLAGGHTFVAWVQGDRLWMIQWRSFRDLKFGPGTSVEVIDGRLCLHQRAK